LVVIVIMMIITVSIMVDDFEIPVHRRSQASQAIAKTRQPE
jgi:hypothetical protein